MKRILIVTHTASMGGGAEKVLSTLVGELSKDFKIDILERLEDSTSPFVCPNMNVRHLHSLSITDKFAIERGKSRLFNRVWRYILSGLIFLVPKVVYKHFIHNEYDYEISFNSLYPSYLVANSLNSKSQKLMWIHGDIYNLCKPCRSFRDFKLKAKKVMQKRAFKKADAIIAISEQTYNSIIQFIPEVKKNVYIINNGYDLQKIKADAKLGNISYNRFSLVSIGRLDKNKNFVAQIRAVTQLINEGFDIELHIIGTGILFRELQLSAGNLLGTYIFLEGFQRNPYPFIKASNALLITSFAEGFPTVAVEAMAIGKPVISTPVAGTSELINEKTGIIIDWSLESIKNGITQVLEQSFDSEYIQDFTSQFSKEIWVKNIKHILN